MTLKKRIVRLERAAKITPRRATHADFTKYAVTGEKPPEGLDWGPILKRLKPLWRRLNNDAKKKN